MADPDLSVESVLIQRSAEEEEDRSPLSGDILEQVLALLSFPEVYGLRSVCKRWNALIQERPWGPFYTPRVGRMGTNSRPVPWSAYDLSETPMREISMPQLEFPECACEGTWWQMIAADGGLLCFSAGFGWRAILVCNPMTNAWRKLPDASRGLIYAYAKVTHMVVDECRSSYKILVAGDDAVALYDSAANTWSVAERLSPEMTLRSGAYCNGEMYFLGQMESNGAYMVRVLEFATLRWRAVTIPIPMPVGSEQYPTIVAWSGEVYFVGGSYESTGNMRTLESILLFRLDYGGGWTRVSEYANRTVLKEIGPPFRCRVWGGRMFVVTCPPSLCAGTLCMVLVYNCATGMWEQPVRERNFDKMKRVYGTVYAFQPNLVVAP